MSMTIQSSVKDKILATQSKTSKVENVSAEMLRDLDQQMEKRANDGKANVYGVRGVILAAQSEAFKQENVPFVGSKMDEAHALSKEWSSDVDHLRLRWEIYFVVLADAVSPWKGVICFGKKGKLAPRYVEPFEILERIGSIAYRLRLPEELSSVHDTFHVSNLVKKCLADANLHVPLDEIEADKTTSFCRGTCRDYGSRN
ncbi:hypothetical protein Tco_0174775 [Tanacetum coccineum]